MAQLSAICLVFGPGGGPRTPMKISLRQILNLMPIPTSATPGYFIQCVAALYVLILIVISLRVNDFYKIFLEKFLVKRKGTILYLFLNLVPTDRLKLSILRYKLRFYRVKLSRIINPQPLFA